MTKDDIMSLALESGMSFLLEEHASEYGNGTFLNTPYPELEGFAKLVAAAEREECAKVCEAVQQKNENNGVWMWEAKNCAAAIRARGNA